MKSVAHNGFGCPYCRTAMAEMPQEEDSDDEYSEYSDYSVDEYFEHDTMRGFRFFWNNVNGISHSREDEIEEDEMEEDEDDIWGPPSRRSARREDDIWGPPSRRSTRREDEIEEDATVQLVRTDGYETEIDEDTTVQLVRTDGYDETEIDEEEQIPPTQPPKEYVVQRSRQLGVSYDDLINFILLDTYKFTLPDDGMLTYRALTRIIEGYTPPAPPSSPVSEEIATKHVAVDHDAQAKPTKVSLSRQVSIY
jgi:hypothetical protein